MEGKFIHPNPEKIRQMESYLYRRRPTFLKRKLRLFEDDGFKCLPCRLSFENAEISGSLSGHVRGVPENPSISGLTQ